MRSRYYVFIKRKLAQDYNNVNIENNLIYTTHIFRKNEWTHIIVSNFII
jgi:hypothetical protein